MNPRNHASAPTISDVAKAVGVSRATVSRAFSRPHMISEETVKRVRAAATRLGYTPNLIARALSTGRQGNIAIVVPDISNPFFPPLLRAAQASADAAGYSVFFGNSDENAGREQVLMGRWRMQVEGFILASSRMPDKKIHEVALRQPVVLVNRDTPGVQRVLIDTTAGIEAAVAHLTELHHRCLVYVSGPAASWADQQRRRAMRRAAGRHNVKMEWISARRATFEAGKEVAPAVMNLDATAAVTFDDSLAHGLLAGLAEQGIIVPKDFSVIGCDDVLGASTHPALTSVSTRSVEAGRMAADLLVSTLQTGKRSEIRLVLNTNLVVRATTAAATARKKTRPRVDRLRKNPTV